MAFTFISCEGFDCGNVTSQEASGVTISSAEHHTGSRSLHLGYQHYAKYPVPNTPDNLGAGAWEKPDEATSQIGIYAELSTGEFVGIKADAANKTYDAYVDGVKVADGTTGVLASWGGSWHNIQLYVYLHDVSGEINAWLEGTQILNFSGDTIPAGATGTVVKIKVEGHGALNWVDDFVWGTGDRPGDVRVDYLVPTADTAQDDFTPTAGDNYACVDEVPASDADYVYTDTNTDADEYDVEDFTATNKTIVGVTVLARAKQDTATAESIKVGVDSNGTDDDTQHALTTSWAYYMHNMGDNPDDAAAWEDADIDALKTRIEAVI